MDAEAARGGELVLPRCGRHAFCDTATLTACGGGGGRQKLYLARPGFVDLNPPHEGLVYATFTPQEDIRGFFRMV